MHLLELFGRFRVNPGVAVARLPRWLVAAGVVAEPAATPAPAVPVVAAPRPEPTPATPPTPQELRRLIFAAVASNDSQRLATMFREEPDAIVDNADWMMVPDALRPNPAAVLWYREGLRAVARYCADSLNRPELFQRLEELGRSTPAVQ